MNWNERYKKESSLTHTLNQAYWTIWPEGPKTMASDISDIAKITSNPDKREQTINTIKQLPGLAGAYARDTINRAKNKLKGLTSEGLDPNTGMLPNPGDSDQYDSDQSDSGEDDSE
jgi:hypothetical protein